MEYCFFSDLLGLEIKALCKSSPWQLLYEHIVKHFEKKDLLQVRKTNRNIALSRKILVFMRLFYSIFWPVLYWSLLASLWFWLIASFSFLKFLYSKFTFISWLLSVLLRLRLKIEVNNLLSVQWKLTQVMTFCISDVF